jgi:hypothetical protein
MLSQRLPLANLDGSRIHLSVSVGQLDKNSNHGSRGWYKEDNARWPEDNVSEGCVYDQSL